MVRSERWIVGASFILLLCACVQPQEVTDTGTRVERRTIQYDAYVAAQKTASSIGLERVAVYGDGKGVMGLYRPEQLALSESELVVADNGHGRIFVFAANGEVVSAFGRRGQGPGEFERVHGIAAVGGQVFVLSDRVRLNVWTAEGDHIREVRFDPSRRFLDLAAFNDGMLIASSTVPPADPRSLQGHYTRQLVASYNWEGEEIRQYAVLHRVFPTRATPRPEVPTARTAVAPQGTVYVTESRFYRILAIDGATGTPRWELEVDVPRLQVTSRDIQEDLAGMRGAGPFTPDQFEWAEYFPAIRGLSVDGHGHLYVFPWTRREPGASHVPVDVFDKNGTHLASAVMPKEPWQVARGDLVYGRGLSEATGEPVVVAYRLVEPFAR